MGFVKRPKIYPSNILMHLTLCMTPYISDGSLDQSLMVDPLSYFLFQPVIQNWYKKICGIFYPGKNLHKSTLAANCRVAHVVADVVFLLLSVVFYYVQHHVVYVIK